ncbi:MAG: BTAD domain-containing putative transcriptional regulator [Bacillota bacterium]|nr:BTAD domain-containing putative transcriptional regulator [Bacillota bacterium]
MPGVNQTICNEDYCIFTLGKFYIRRGDTVISESSSRSKKMWEVFRYLLSNRGRALFPEAILEAIWPEKDYSDPNTVMRALMFRLRQALGRGNEGESLASNIIFKQGVYRWEDKVSCWIDIDAFETLTDQAGDLREKDPDGAADFYQQAINLYRGEYLPESTFSEWVIPLRSYYRNLFLNSVYALADLLKKKHVYKEIIKLCEQAIAVEYYEEKIHVRLLEALLAEGQNTRVRAHYSEVTSAFYREMGIKPSNALKNIYRQAGLEAGSFELDLGVIQEGLKDKQVSNGAYLSDAELFSYFYKLERLRGERSGKSVLLCLMTITDSDYRIPPQERLKEVMNRLQETILDSLRKGDLVTRWNEAQFLLLLPGLNREQAQEVMDRIEERFLKDYPLSELILRKKVETLLPLETDAYYV